MNDEPMTSMAVKIPARLKSAAVAEAKRRGINLSALVKIYLSNFLPENIEKSINGVEREK